MTASRSTAIRPQQFALRSPSYRRTLCCSTTASLLTSVSRGQTRAVEIDEAVRLAGLAPLIELLPDGLQTIVGERGLKLSGGEKQRVAIARAILKRPRLFVLDEATSALDSTTEKTILDNLARTTAGVTTIMIAHRLSTIRAADKIFVIDHGRIVEQGNHTELLVRDGLYAQLWRTQTNHSEDTRCSQEEA